MRYRLPPACSGALGRVLREVPGDLLLAPVEQLHLDLRAPGHLATTEIRRRPAGHSRHRVAQRLLEKRRGVLRGRPVVLVRSLGRHLAVQAHEDVEMDEASALELGHLQIGDPRLALELRLRDPQKGGEATRQVDRRVAPELTQAVVPRHRRLVVEALRAQRLTNALLPRLMANAAPHRAAVRAHGTIASRAARRRLAPGTVAAGVYRAEARCGQRGEHHRVTRDRLGDALAAEQTGEHELECVAAVTLSAGRADGFAPIPAPLAKHSVGLIVGGEHDPPALIAGLAGETDRPGAVPGGAQLARQRLELAVPHPVENVVQDALGHRHCVDVDLV